MVDLARKRDTTASYGQIFLDPGQTPNQAVGKTPVPIGASPPILVAQLQESAATISGGYDGLVSSDKDFDEEAAWATVKRDYRMTTKRLDDQMDRIISLLEKISES